MKLWRLSNIEGSILKYRVPPLWPAYIGEKENTICQSIWDKSEVLRRTCWGTHWELGEHIGNLMGTNWELKGNIVRTHWQPGKYEKKSSPLPFPKKTLKRKKQGTLSACLGLPISCMKFLFTKSSSPFLAWPNNTPCKEESTYLGFMLLLHSQMSKPQT